MLSSTAGRPDCFIALMPRSDRARFIDLVKFSGTVLGCRKSISGQLCSCRVYIRLTCGNRCSDMASDLR